jgi:hypothetical protein
MKKPYFAIFGLPKPTYEHAKIVEVIRAASNGDFKQFPLPGGMGFVFTSEELPWNLSFDRILMNTDSKLIFEIGSNVTHQGYGAAAGWLNSHFPRQ